MAKRKYHEIDNVEIYSSEPIYVHEARYYLGYMKKMLGDYLVQINLEFRDDGWVDMTYKHSLPYTVRVKRATNQYSDLMDKWEEEQEIIGESRAV